MTQAKGVRTRRWLRVMERLTSPLTAPLNAPLTVRLTVVSMVALALTACGHAPRTPDWRIEARDALERSTQAYLSGRDAAAQADHARARQALSASAQPELIAKAELLRCAARVASLEGLPERAVSASLGPADTRRTASACPGFDTWRTDASPALQAYADWLSGGLPTQDSLTRQQALALLPAEQRAAAETGQDAVRREAAIRAIQEPLSRLLAAAVALRDGVAPPGIVALAIETASDQGWRRPLLAWLTFQVKRAEQAGDAPEADALRRRIQLVTTPNPGAAASGAVR
jgi:hypothetical protein